MRDPHLTEHDRETIREIQERVGVDQTGEIDSQTVLAIHETLGLAQKLFIRQFGHLHRLTPPPGSQ
ncbi:MAG: hypothetical protein P4L99_28200 [Chthoniobacter sp.]|nr:hypothetical protein [Chthoniobacter sp.]